MTKALRTNTNADDAQFAITEEEAAELMMRVVVNNAVLRNKGKKGPDVSILQRAVSILPPHLGEQFGSMHRHRLIDAVCERKPEETWVQGAIRRLFGQKADHLALQGELQWLQQHGDGNSPTMVATEADIQMHLGNTDEARATYAEALRLAREQGITFSQ